MIEQTPQEIRLQFPNEKLDIQERLIHKYIDGLGARITSKQRQEIGTDAMRIANDLKFQNAVILIKMGTITAEHFDQVKAYVEAMEKMAKGIEMENEKGKNVQIGSWASGDAIRVAINAVWDEISVGKYLHNT